jgi:ABC-type nickel/cobalt efflux system permease component RcnA
MTMNKHEHKHESEREHGHRHGHEHRHGYVHKAPPNFGSFSYKKNRRSVIHTFGPYPGAGVTLKTARVAHFEVNFCA